MTFTPKQTKLIQRFRKQDRQWRWARWLVLAMGILSAGLCIGFGWFLSLLIRDSSHQLSSGDAFVFALLWTKCCLYLVSSTWCFATVATKWSGDVTRILLLRLIDDQEKVNDDAA